MKFNDRLAKLEARHRGSRTAAPVFRHIIHGDSDAERRAQADAIIASTPRAFHVFRMMVQPGELGAAA